MKANENVQEGDEKETHDVSLDGALKYEHISAVEGTLDDSFKAHLHLRFKLTVQLELSCT